MSDAASRWPPSLLKIRDAIRWPRRPPVTAAAEVRRLWVLNSQDWLEWCLSNGLFGVLVEDSQVERPALGEIAVLCLGPHEYGFDSARAVAIVEITELMDSPPPHADPRFIPLARFEVVVTTTVSGAPLIDRLLVDRSVSGQRHLDLTPEDLEALLATLSTNQRVAEAVGALESDEAQSPEDIGDVVPRDLARTFSLEQFKSGDWFAQLLRRALITFEKNLTDTYFREKYGSLPPDEIADQFGRACCTHAAVQGGSIGAAYAAAIAVTIGSKGIAVPAAGAALVTDLATISWIQLRLAYGLGVIYGHPLDQDDPEDMVTLLWLALGIRLQQVAGAVTSKLAPEVTRRTVLAVASGARLQWLQSLPIIGKQLLQRNLIKAAIPVVSIGTGAGLNWLTTRGVTKRAQTHFRTRSAIAEEARRGSPVETDEFARALLRAVRLVTRIDGQTHTQEALYLSEVIKRLKLEGVGAEVLEEFQATIDTSECDVVENLAKLEPEEREAILQACVVAAAVDGQVTKEEQALLHRLAEACGVTGISDQIDRVARRFR